MPRTGITRVFRELGSLAAEYAEDRIGLDVNIVIGQLPGTTPETAVSVRGPDGRSSPCKPAPKMA